MIPVIDIGPLFAADASGRRSVDQELSAAARDIGFLRGLPAHLAPRAEHTAQLLEVFSLHDADKRRITSFVEFRGMENERVQAGR
ncbi:MAG: hypothetical protein JO299_14685 [Gammaproteobacteria bacterium]|nr:hypothetical protein [Gammaproteobacteria bacterium]